MNISRSTFKEVTSYREPLRVQIEQYYSNGNGARDFSGDFNSDLCNESEMKTISFTNRWLKIVKKRPKFDPINAGVFFLEDRSQCAVTCTKLLLILIPHLGLIHLSKVRSAI